MLSIQAELTARVAAAFAAAGIDPEHGVVVPSQRPELAQFQCNGALAAAKAAGRNPRDIARDVADRLAEDPAFTEPGVAGPGFINLSVTDAFLAAFVDRVTHDPRLGVPQVDPVRRIIVDYGGPNVAKELHVGHLRPALIGESVKRALAFAGHDVTGDVHLGDWGTPMGQLLVELARQQPDLPYFDPDHSGPYPQTSPVTVEELNRLYPQASSRAQADPEAAEAARRATFELQDGRPGYRALWNHFRTVSVEAMQTVYEDLGVHFERWYGEATVHDRMAPLVARLRDLGVAVESHGAIVIDVQQEGDTRELPPLLLVKSDGGYTYHTSDLATIEDRAADGFEQSVYIVDNRQSDHFEQVFRAARLGKVVPDSTSLIHAGNGTVNGPGGKPLRTRDGDLPLLRDLIRDAVALASRRMDERGLAVDYPPEERAGVARLVGLAALKFGDLSNHRTSNYTFDLERFTSFDGRTGPYLLYGAVRMRSILRETARRDIRPGPVVAAAGEADRNLMLALTRLPEVLTRTIEHVAPNHLAEHAYDLVSEFNRFYEACRIVDEPDAGRQGSWLTLVDVTLRQLLLLLDLLVIEVPERM